MANEHALELLSPFTLLARSSGRTGSQSKSRGVSRACSVDLEVLKDDGYRYVTSYPPDGSEGVDVIGMAATWLTKRMTVDARGLVEEAVAERGFPW